MTLADIVPPSFLGEIIDMVAEGTITRHTGRQLIADKIRRSLKAWKLANER